MPHHYQRKRSVPDRMSLEEAAKAVSENVSCEAAKKFKVNRNTLKLYMCAKEIGEAKQRPGGHLSLPETNEIDGVVV